MAVHAAMVEVMDTEIGRILDCLKRSGQLENTCVFFLSDNGASAEIMVRGDGHNPDAPPGTEGYIHEPHRLVKYLGKSSYLIEKYAKNLWLKSWHDVMVRRGYDYSKLEHRISAVRQMSSDNSLLANNLPAWAKATCLTSSFKDCDSPEIWRKNKELDDVYGCSNGACADATRSKEELLHCKYKYCGRCNSAAYCSEECQKADWPKHKQRCRLIVEELKKTQAAAEARALPPSKPSSSSNTKSSSIKVTKSVVTSISEAERLCIEQQLILEEEEEAKKKQLEEVRKKKKCKSRKGR
jgi:hypothetical protein